MIVNYSMATESNTNLNTETLGPIYLKYQNLEDMLKVILFASQSPIGMIPMLYNINYKNNKILFIETGTVNPTIHYIIIDQEPSAKFIDLKQLTGKFNYVDAIGNDTQSLYIPILKLDESSFNFPI